MIDPLRGGTAPLHPNRVAETLKRLSEPDSRGWVALDAGQQNTCKAALKMLQKAQRATGLTPEVADAVTHGLGMLDYVKKALKPK